MREKMDEGRDGQWKRWTRSEELYGVREMDEGKREDMDKGRGG